MFELSTLLQLTGLNHLHRLDAVFTRQERSWFICKRIINFTLSLGEPLSELRQKRCNVDRTRGGAASAAQPVDKQAPHARKRMILLAIVVLTAVGLVLSGEPTRDLDAFPTVNEDGDFSIHMPGYAPQKVRRRLWWRCENAGRRLRVHGGEGATRLHHSVPPVRERRSRASHAHIRVRRRRPAAAEAHDVARRRACRQPAG